MDLKRIALAYYYGSESTAIKFIDEANKRISEIDSSLVKPYLNDYLCSIHEVFKNKDRMHLAEACLMYSQIFQNYANTFEK
jgi:hypothetical protein